ncbi:MAG: HAD family phosphatase, partial [Actinobacteria bacterium]|nr:HAD family phosphatase [Actinomycetota bacterium]
MSAILFDMDGTLIDSEPLWFAAEVEVMAELGAIWEPSDQINCL